MARFKQKRPRHLTITPDKFVDTLRKMSKAHIVAQAIRRGWVFCIDPACHQATACSGVPEQIPPLLILQTPAIRQIVRNVLWAMREDKSMDVTVDVAANVQLLAVAQIEGPTVTFTIRKQQ